MIVVVALAPVLAAAPALADPIEVTSLADAGEGSLRAAIAEAEQDQGRDEIAIAVHGTIELATPLPSLTTAISITGPGADALEIERDPEAAPTTFRILTVAPAGDVEVEGLTLSGGRDADPAGAAGGVVANRGVLALRDVAIKGGEAVSGPNFLATGGGIENDGTLVVEDSVITGNVAGEVGGQARGGAIHSNGTLVVRRSALRGNAAIAAPGAGGGGAIFVASGTAAIEASEIAANLVPGGPGEGQGAFAQAAVLNGAATSLVIENTTISGNDGGVASWVTGTTTIHSSTLVAGAEGSLLAGTDIDVASTIELQNTLLAGGEPDRPLCNPAAETELVSLGNNLATDGSCAFFGPSDRAGADPGLGPLALRGGSTRTHGIARCGPAADAGRAAGVSADQRGLPRPVGHARRPKRGDGADIGAFERQGQPCNRHRVSIASRRRAGAVLVRARVPGPGRVVVAGRRLTRRLVRPGREGWTRRLVVRPTGEARRALRERGRLRAAIRIAYRPRGGSRRVVRRVVRFERAR